MHNSTENNKQFFFQECKAKTKNRRFLLTKVYAK